MATDLLKLLAPFEAVCAKPYEAAKAAAESGRKVAGVMCSYAPQELIHAAGFVPVRILGREGGTPQADNLIQAYACSFARSTLDCALAGEFDFLDLVVFSHTCDTMQNLADLWRRNRPGVPVVIVSPPTRMDGPEAETYFRKELDRVRALLEEATEPIPEGKLQDSVKLYAWHQTLMRRLYTLRRQHPTALSGRQMMAVVTSSFLMPREDHVERLTALLNALETPHAAVPADAPKVFVTGSVCQSLSFIEAIEEAGCIVVDDDLCIGARSFVMPDINESEPMDAMVQMYMARPPCPAFHKTDFDPGRHVLEGAQRAQADGVVFLTTKFCDPIAFDLPHIMKTLEAAGMPSLLLEIEQNLPVPEQLRTRAAAFVETLPAGDGQ
jgi:bcr-type benzoyl-CoA reductase subunit C